MDNKPALSWPIKSVFIADEGARQKILLLLNNIIIVIEGNDAVSLDGFPPIFS